jgi:hypothetical protein
VLSEHHKKYGFKTRLNQGRIMLCDPFGITIGRYPIEGIMSAKVISDAADKWIQQNIGDKYGLRKAMEKS